MKTTSKMYDGYSENAIDKLRNADNLKFCDCIPLYDEVIRLFPEPPYAYAKRGYAKYKTGNFVEAINDFDEA